MESLLYIRLIGFTAGTLLQLFWMVVILGYRRQRNFERVFFFMCLALFLFYGGLLLALNAQIYYATPPMGLESFAFTLIAAGLCVFPALLFHLNIEYAKTRGLLRAASRWRLVLVAFYAPAVYFALRVYPLLASEERFDFLEPGNVLGREYGIWLVISLLAATVWQFRFARQVNARAERTFHRFLAGSLLAGAVLAGWLHVGTRPLSPVTAATGSTILALLAIPPLALLIVLVQRYNFLQIGRQKNLVYAVTVTFLGLFYLALARRVGTWLEPVLPPEASAAILLFVLVIFFEPLQRVLGRRLKETAHREVEQAQRLMAEIQQEARQGNPEKLARFIEARVKATFELAKVKMTVQEPRTVSEGVRQFAREHGMSDTSYGPPQCGLIVLRGKPPEPRLMAGDLVGILAVLPHGAALSGETRAALELLCEQLPSALDLCRLIDEKLRLERELAERERLAALGRMAASISHNLKNPLGSIKTILQVQLEGPEMPESLRGETRMVLEEIERLSAKLNQLLQFSRPTLRGEKPAGECDLVEAVKDVTGVLRHEAERKGIALQMDSGEQAAWVRIGKEGANDVVSNLVVNALEATPSGGHVCVGVARHEGDFVLRVEDDGAGIPAELKEKVLQPFFTTKTQGTGLGLAIVARRVEEAGGTIEWRSPAKDGRGTRFEARFPGVLEQ